jgi:S-methylmethionine-dependent homocysteine/selenocysteine methylase
MARRSPRIIDGGTGTELERRGVPMHGHAWSAGAVLSHPNVLLAVHRDFLCAGADTIIANTFSASEHSLAHAGLGEHFEAINRAAVRIALRAAASCPGGPIVAGALSTTTFTGALDYSRLKSGEAAVAQYARQATIQAEAGAELLFLEMMRDCEQTACALEGALRTGLPVWVGFSTFTGQDGAARLADTDIPLARALREVDLAGAAAVGIMHTLVEHTPLALDTLRASWSGTTFAYPHAGRFEMPNWIFQDVTTPEAFARMGLALFDSGVEAVGGCCGIGPEHIRALAGALGGQGPPPPASRHG